MLNDRNKSLLMSGAVFLLVLFGGYGVLSRPEVIETLRSHRYIYWWLGLIYIWALASSILAHLWWLCFLTGQEITRKIRRAVMILHIALILPGMVAMTAATFVHYLFKMFTYTDYFLDLSWGLIGLALAAFGLWLLRTPSISTLIGHRSLLMRLSVLVLAGISVWFLSVVVIGSIFGGI